MPLELGLHERVEVAVQDGAGVAGLVARAQVLDHLVRVQDVAPDLVAPARLDVLALELADLGLLLLERALEEPGLEDLDRHLLVLGLAALVLALGDDPGRQVGQADGRIGLVDVLAAGALGAEGVDPDLVPVELDLDVVAASGRTSTSANVVCRRFCESNGLIRPAGGRPAPRAASRRPAGR